MEISEKQDVLNTLKNAIEICYYENSKGNFEPFEDLVFFLEKDITDEIESEISFYDNQKEADSAFFERFGHLGSI